MLLERDRRVQDQAPRVYLVSFNEMRELKGRWVWCGDIELRNLSVNIMFERACVTVWSSPKYVQEASRVEGRDLTRTEGTTSQLLATSTLFLSQVPCPQRYLPNCSQQWMKARYPQYSILNSNHQLYCQAVVTQRQQGPPKLCTQESSFLLS